MHFRDLLTEAAFVIFVTKLRKSTERMKKIALAASLPEAITVLSKYNLETKI